MKFQHLCELPHLADFILVCRPLTVWVDGGEAAYFNLKQLAIIANNPSRYSLRRFSMVTTISDTKGLRGPRRHRRDFRVSQNIRYWSSISAKFRKRYLSKNSQC